MPRLCTVVLLCCSVCKCKAIMWHDQVLNNNHNKISASKTQSKFRWIFWLFVLELITLEWSYEPEMRANSICLVFYDWDTWCTAIRAQNRNILTMCDTRLSQQTWMPYRELSCSLSNHWHQRKIVGAHVIRFTIYVKHWNYFFLGLDFVCCLIDRFSMPIRNYQITFPDE